jgi:hypothetical protein
MIYIVNIPISKVVIFLANNLDVKRALHIFCTSNFPKGVNLSVSTIALTSLAFSIGV